MDSVRKKSVIFLLFCALFCVFNSCAGAGWCPDVVPNTLSDIEIDAGCILLFNGYNLDGWEYLRPLDSNWTIRDGVLTTSHLDPSKKRPTCDLATTKNFTNGIFKFEWRLDVGGNSGVKYFCDPIAMYNGIGMPPKRSAVCPEYQILDDNGFFPDSLYPNRTAGALYDLIAPYKHKPLNPIGEWNCGEIHTDGMYTEFWMNGQLLVHFDRYDASFRQLVARSKFNAKTFGLSYTSPLVLQDHGQAAYFRSVKYCPMDSDA